MKNPYLENNDLGKVLFEIEWFAKHRTDGGIILIRTKNGWRAFLANFPVDVLANFETTINNNVPNQYDMRSPSRFPTLSDALINLWGQCSMLFPELRRKKDEEL